MSDRQSRPLLDAYPYRFHRRLRYQVSLLSRSGLPEFLVRLVTSCAVYISIGVDVDELGIDGGWLRLLNAIKLLCFCSFPIILLINNYKQ